MKDLLNTKARAKRARAEGVAVEPKTPTILVSNADMFVTGSSVFVPKPWPKCIKMCDRLSIFFELKLRGHFRLGNEWMSRIESTERLRKVLMTGSMQ